MRIQCFQNVVNQNESKIELSIMFLGIGLFKIKFVVFFSFLIFPLNSNHSVYNFSGYYTEGKKSIFCHSFFTFSNWKFLEFFVVIVLNFYYNRKLLGISLRDSIA